MILHNADNTPLKIITFSDIHADGKGNTTWANKSLELCEKIASEKGDILLLGGDAAETAVGFHAAFDKLQHFKGIKLFYGGNNDLEILRTTNVKQYATLLQEQCAKYGFHVLDNDPRKIGKWAIVGNVGWFDASLFTVLDHYLPSSLYPRSLNEARKNSAEFFHQNIRNIIGDSSITYEEFFEFTYEQIRSQLQTLNEDDSIDHILLGIHHVPSNDFTKSGLNEKYDFHNFHMGSRSYGPLYNAPKVKLGLTGHTHRDDNHMVGRTRVFNVSSTSHQLYNIFYLQTNGKVVWEVPQ